MPIDRPPSWRTAVFFSILVEEIARVIFIYRDLLFFT